MRVLQTSDAMYYSAQRLGDNSHRTNEGYLLFTGVPIARAGQQLYTTDDLPGVEGNSAGEIVVDRPEAEVFRPETIASFNGKPIVVDHPMDEDAAASGWDVNPDNVQQYEIGVTLNPRRGEGEFKDFIVADLMIKRRDAIDEVQNGRRQISCGYDAQYESVAPGHAVQRNIVGNHVALVDLARCGPSCSIRDGESRMSAVTSRERGNSRVTRFFDSLRAAFDRKDPKAFEDHITHFRDELVNMGEADGDHHVHVHVGGELPQTGEGLRDTAGRSLTGDAAVGALARLVRDNDKKYRAAFRKIGDSLKILAARARDEGEREREDEEDEDRTHDEESEREDGREREGEDRTHDEENERGERREERRDDTRDGGIFSGEIDLRDPEKDATGINPGGLRTAATTPVARDHLGRRGRDSAAGGGRVRVRDSAHLENSFADLLSRAELLLPGVRQPTWDAHAPAPQTLGRMCAFRRRVLAEAWQTADGRTAIEPVANVTHDDISPLLRRMTCDAVHALFNGAAEMARHSNNLGGLAPVVGARRATADHSPTSIAEINAANRKFYEKMAR